MSIRLKKNSIFIVWMVSYLIVICISLVSGVVIYYESSQIIESDINDASEIMLNLLKEKIDEQLLTISKLAINISLNKRIQSLYKVKELDADNRIDILLLFNELTPLSLQNEFIQSYYIFFDSGDFVVSNNSYSKAEQAYATYHENAPIDYRTWRELMESDKEGIHIIENNNDDHQDDQILYMINLPYGSNEPLAKIVVTLSRERILEMINSIDWMNEENFIIADENQVILKNGEIVNSLDEFKTITSQDERDIIDLKIQDQEMVMIQTRSSVLDWKYIRLISKAVFYQKARFIFILTIIGIGATVVVGILLAYIFVKRDYASIEDILKLLKTKQSIKKKENIKNEFEFIKKNIGEMKSMLNSHSSVVKENVVLKLLEGQVSDTSAIEAFIESYDLLVENSIFCVVIFESENLELNMERTEQPIDEIELIKFVIKNILEEISDGEFRFVLTNRGFRFPIIVSSRNQKNYFDIDYLVDVVERTYIYLKETFGYEFTVGISNSFNQVEKLGRAYVQAGEAISLKLIRGLGSIIIYENVEGKIDGYTYSLEIEQQLINNIRVGDVEKTLELIDYIFKINFEDGKISHEMALLLIFELVSTLMKAIQYISTNNDFIGDKNTKFLQKVLALKTLSEMKIEIIQMVQQVCIIVNKQKNNFLNTRNDGVVEFIKASYQNSDLNVAMIANHFKINASYISSEFKVQMGLSILDYISKLRIEKAKILFQQGLNVNDVAQSVGFSNYIAMNRAFKKHEGITPGRYKEMIINNKN